MKRRPLLLPAILLYVALDLSLPAMPGAFVFDPSDSVELIQPRGRAAVETVPLPTPVGGGERPLQPHREVKARPAPSESVERGGRPVLTWRSRALRDPAPPSEDPH